MSQKKIKMVINLMKKSVIGVYYYYSGCSLHKEKSTVLRDSRLDLGLEKPSSQLWGISSLHCGEML